MQSQNINRSVLDRETIEVEKLMEISKALNFDFFQYYKPFDCEDDDLQDEKETQPIRDEIIKLRAENNILKKIVGIRENNNPLEKENVG